jgi:hypothetical protein
MPGLAGRRAAIVLALLMAACGTSTAPTATTSTPSPPPSPAASPSTGAGWIENLTLSGDLKGNATVVPPNVGNQQSECSGKNSRTGGTWASTIYVLLGSQKYGVAFLSTQYRGPATYAEDAASVQVFTPDHAKAWQNLASDPVKFTVNADEESGTVDATLTNLSNAQTKLMVKGTWSCRT